MNLTDDRLVRRTQTDGLELMDDELEDVVGGLNRVWTAGFADSSDVVEPALGLSPPALPALLPVVTYAER